MRSCLHVLGLATFLATTSPGLGAQVIDGQVADGETFGVLEGVTLTLMDPDGRDLGEPVASSESGRFSMTVPGAGSYYLRIEKLGYTGIVEGVFGFESSVGRLAVEVYLRRAPVELEGVDVAVEEVQARRSLRAAGFYSRLTSGFGDFITPEEIEARGMVGNVSELLRRVPGTTTYGTLLLFRATGAPPKGLSRAQPNPRGGSGPLQYCRSAEGPCEELGLCEPNVWLNGVLTTKANTNGVIEPGDLERGVDGYLTANDVAAIEVYRTAASTPLQWGGLGSNCGTVVIWTKQGR